MVPDIRSKYNSAFTKEKYETFLNDLASIYPGQLDFRVAETPVFISRDFIRKVISACEAVIDVIILPEYRKKSEAAIPPSLRVPNEDEHPHFIAFDFGICLNEKGELEPQLIEMQAFPTLFAWHLLLPEKYRDHFWLPENFTHFLNDFDRTSYTDLLKKIILGDADPEKVILLEIFPEQQKTRIDFAATQDLIGIRTVCLTKIIQEGKDLYYDRDGKKTRIERIYNRLIFDDLFHQTPEVQEKGKIFQQDLNVKWIPHPNWFYRLSKFTLPFINHPYVPETHFLNEVNQLPDDLENYVVKPLFSFAGQGVIIDVNKDAIDQIRDPENWILQRKVKYAAVIDTPDEAAKAELRIFYFWEEDKPRPIATNNLARLSKGKMVGVRYNKDKEWVGGSFGMFENTDPVF
jgi:hypothetical protein